MLYAFTNRRRAKDAIMIIRETKGDQGISILVKEGLVYIEVDPSFPALTSVMHFSELCLVSDIHDLLDDKVEEYYHNRGIAKFRV